MARGNNEAHNPKRKVGRAELENTTGSLFGAMESLKSQLIAQGRYNPEWDKEEEEK